MIDDDLITDDDLDLGSFRAELSSLADAGAPKLTKAARTRILDHVQERGPELATAPPARSRWAWAALGVAAAAGLAFWLVGGPGEPPVATAPACSRWESALAIPRDGQLDLSHRGSATYAGVVTVDAVDGCTTELDLRSGHIDVRADDLGGGTLRVVAGEISVEVRGTRFSVSHDGAHVEVIVQEGHVVVQAPSEREIHLHGGERWSRGARRAEREAAPSRETIAAPIPEPSTPESATPESSHAEPPSARPPRQASDRSRLADAERLWREGERDAARRIFRRVGAGRGGLAEAAWVRLARLELRGGEPRNARAATTIQRRRFPRSRLGAEALWIQADAARSLGDRHGVARALRMLRERYPNSPQARAASAASTETP